LPPSGVASPAPLKGYNACALQMIHWNLSGGIVHRGLLLPFIDALEARNVSLSVHDGFSGLSWSGGRESGSAMDPGALDGVLEQYRRRGVGFNLLFSNHLLGPDDLGHEYGNWLLQKLHDELNGVVVCDGVLADYVRERYPKYQLVRSVVNAYLDKIIYRRPDAIVRYFEEKLRQYDRVVVPSELNLRFELLDQLDKSKLEFLVNNNCFWHCPFVVKHYTQIAHGFRAAGGSPTRVCMAEREAMGLGRDRLLEHLRKYDAVLNDSGKPIQKIKFGQRITLRKSWLKPEQVGLMQRRGCVHFKLQGRDVDPHAFEETLRLLVVDYDA
jgi:collagenase-like PrtC family protease